MIRRMRRITLVAARLALLIVATELAVRGHSWWVGEQRFHALDPQLGWRTNANLRRVFVGGEGAYLVETNSRGFRDADHSYAKPANAYRVVVLGASTIFGDGVHQDALCTELLEKALPHTEVINLSCGAYAPDQQHLVLQREGYKYDPDLVVQFLIRTDIDSPFVDWDVMMQRPKCCLLYDGERISLRPPHFPPWQGLLSNSYVAEKAFLFASPLTFAASSLITPQAELTTAQRAEALRLLLLQTWQQCHERGIRYLAAYLPVSSELADDPVPDGRLALRQLMSRMQSEDGFPLLDLTGALRQAHADPQRGPLVNFLGLHLNSRGHVALATEVAKELLPLATAGRTEQLQAGLKR